MALPERSVRHDPVNPLDVVLIGGFLVTLLIGLLYQRGPQCPKCRHGHLSFLDTDDGSTLICRNARCDYALHEVFQRTPV